MKVKSYLKYAPDTELTLRLRSYYNKRLAILATSPEGEPVATLTVNMPEIALSEDEIIIKDWSENEGALETLQQARLVEVVAELPAGYCTAYVCRWLGDRPQQPPAELEKRI